MLSSFAMTARQLCRRTIEEQFIGRNIVPKSATPHTRQFLTVFVRIGTGEAQRAAITEPPIRDKMQISIRFPTSLIPSFRRDFMVITTAHISPIMSLIAGLLILIMPRLLNLIVAIFLILNGLIGLGLLRWFHL
jgi:hypothetical protein